MNFWTFLDRNLFPLVVFVFFPLLVLAAIGGPSIVHALRTPPACVDNGAR